MKIEAVYESNGLGCLIWAANYPGVCVRGRTENEAMAKFPGELRGYLRWLGMELDQAPLVEIIQRHESALHTEDADSDLLFDCERQPLDAADYDRLKLMVLRSARDFRTLYQSISNPDISGRAPRLSFYGPVPRTPREMYEHTNNTTAYYAAAFGIDLENMPDIYVNRLQVLAEIESLVGFDKNQVYTAPDGELWTLRKLLRRFLWHDRIHAKAMWRTAVPLWGSQVQNPFCFL